MSKIVVLIIVLVTLVLFAVILTTYAVALLKDMGKEHIVDEKIDTGDYEKPTFKKMTEDQIDDIHSRGRITPEEKVKEWEGLDLCAPGDAIGSSSWRCKKFNHNCHDCLVDFANENDEYYSIYDIFDDDLK